MQHLIGFSKGSAGGRQQARFMIEPLLLDAAHIVTDKDERFGQPVMSNGIPLPKIHHAAFDAYLIGIDPDYRLHVSDRLLAQNDGARFPCMGFVKEAFQ